MCSFFRLLNLLLTITIATEIQLCEPGGSLHSVPLHEQKVPAKTKGNYSLFKSVFFGHVQVGSSEYSVVFDSGSGHLILPSIKCASPACKKHLQYNVTESPTGVDIDYDGTPVTGMQRDELTVSFGTGEVSGVFARDRVCLGSWGRSCIDAHIITATRMSDNPFLDFGFDGVLGLALPGLSQTEQFNLGTLLADQGNGMFAVRLTGAPELTFGGYRPEYLAAPLEWVPVVDPEEGYWKMRVLSVLVGGEELEVCVGGCMAVADTGTSVLAGPSSAIALMRESLAGTTVVGGRCSHNTTVELVLEGGTVLLLAAEDVSQPRLPLGSGPDAQAEEGAACDSMLMKLDVPPPLGPLFVVGAPFLKKYYTVFDVANTRVGFGLADRDALPRGPVGTDSSAGISLLEVARSQD